MTEDLITFETAKLAKEKGFTTHTVTTKFTNDYLLGGKNMMINETCILLWLCKLQKWLREIHNIYVSSDHDLDPTRKFIIYYTNWGFINDPSSKNYKYHPEGSYDESNNWKTYEEALEYGLQEPLKLI